MKTRILACAALALAATSAVAAEDVHVQFYTPEIVRITKLPDGVAVEPKSLVVIAEPEQVKLNVTEKDGTTTYRSSALTVKAAPDGRVSFYRPDGTLLVAEGRHGFTPITEGIDKGSFKVLQSWALDPDEPIYGVGMMQNGKMSLRGEHRVMQQTNLEDFAHFFQSIKGYGIYWDNYSPTALDDDGTLALESQVGDAVDYYFMNGGDADGVIACMRRLTGSVPMLPLWTYGFHQSRERYKTQDEILDVVRRYRELGIPLDGIIQDWQYWGSNYTWNAMEFINPDYNRAQEMIDSIHARNARISISIWASFGPQTKQYRELADRGLLFSFETWPQSGLSEWPPRMDYPSGVKVYDCYSDTARAIYWKHLRRLHGMGIDAWWMDSTDPDHLSYRDSDLDEACSMGSLRRVRNLFPFMTVGGVDSRQRAEDRYKRVFILTRSFFAGQQRYGANTWSGDVGSSWESLRNQVPLCLNHTLTGNPNVNTDIGGFFAGSYNRNWDPASGARNPQFQELYTRWMQFGLFNPMMRSHGTDVYRELYYYGKPGEPIYDALVDAVKMRYRLMPYIYSTARRVSTHDDSFMRALFMDFRDDPATWHNGREFMFGRSLLVCPVLDPLYTEEKVVKTDEMSGWDKDAEGGAGGWAAVDWAQPRTYSVYLPAGTDWYDFYTGRKYNGGTTVEADAPISRSPLYVKAGSILPLAEDMQYTGEKPWDVLTLNVYPGADAEFTLYEDEGDNYNYLDGLYTEIPMHWSDRTRTLTIGTRRGSYAGMPATRTFLVQLPDGTTRSVSYAGRKVAVNL
ncbi:MAG: glycoside hydrolase family 31 protein [Muribaculaceae bacterium]|nr:glycoside hydrolase family 31 protein [Muribaculaceae bacterium]